MALNNSVSWHANASRRKVPASALMYAISLTVRPASAAGEELEEIPVPRPVSRRGAGRIVPVVDHAGPSVFMTG